MATLDQFLPYLSPAVAGAPYPLQVRAVRDAAIQFCAESQLFEQRLEPVSSIANATEYELEPPEGMVVAAIVKAWFGDKELKVATSEDEVTPDMDAVEQPTHILFRTNATFSLLPPAKTSGTVITLQAALKPSRSAEEVPDQLYEDFAEEVAAGAASRLFGTSGTPFYDLAKSAAEMMKMQSGISKAKRRRVDGNVGKRELRVEGPRIV